jgi:hypothetical protein
MCSMVFWPASEASTIPTSGGRCPTKVRSFLFRFVGDGVVDVAFQLIVDLDEIHVELRQLIDHLAAFLRRRDNRLLARREELSECSRAS